MSRATHLSSTLATVMPFAAIVASLLMLVGAVAAGAVLTLVAWSTLFVLAALGVIPLCCVGLFIGALARAFAAC